jgi:hypothetical protein
MILGGPQYRFTLFNTALYPAGIVVPAPLGWRDASISLERHETFYSLIEYFKGSFTWYGLAREVIREVEVDQGPDAQLRVLIEVTYGIGWDEVFDGLVDIIQQQDIAKGNTFYKQSVPIIRDDFWAKFINRKETPVNLEATLDLDGGTRTAVNKIVLPLPSQVIRNKSDYYESQSKALYKDYVASSDYIQIGFDRFVLDEAKRNLNLPTDINNTIPVGMWEAESDGQATFNPIISVSIFSQEADVSGATDVLSCFASPKNPRYDYSSPYINFYIQKNEETPIILTADDNSIVLTKRGTKYSISQAFSILKGDQVRIYGEIYDDGWKSDFGNISSILIWGEEATVNTYQIISYNWLPPLGPCVPVVDFDLYPHGDIPTDLEITKLFITQDTTFPDSETDAYLIKDAAESILSKITGRNNVITSNLLTTGCERLRAIMRGKHARGYPFSEKEMFMSFKDWWEGAGMQLALGLGYTEISGVPKIEIEKIEDFFDPDFTVTFDNVGDLVREYDLEKFYKTVEIGYQKWSSESDSGIDDPQTKRVYSTRFKTVGNEKKILSSWIAASLAIEKSRRNRVELGKDDRNDEEIFSICVQPDGSDYTPELDENFTAVTGLLNVSTRYNIRDSVARVFRRWQKFLQGCLQFTTGEKFYFASGEGNYDMSSTLDPADCEYDGGSLSEKQDIDVTAEFITIPKVYKFKAKMTHEKYKSIVANRKKAIGISKTATGNVPAFIVNLDFKLAQGQGEFLVILGSTTEI